MRLLIIILFIYAMAFCIGSCKKFVEVPPPPTQLTGIAVYESNSTAAAAVSGIYQSMVDPSLSRYIFGDAGISALPGLSADEFRLYPGSNQLLNAVYTNNILSTTGIMLWPNFYKIIYQSNSAIEGISTSSGITPSMKNQLIGEAKFARAFCYFFMSNLYGEVPLITSTEYKSNMNISRAPRNEVNQLILSDLMDAQNFYPKIISNQMERLPPPE